MEIETIIKDSNQDIILVEEETKYTKISQIRVFISIELSIIMLVNIMTES